MASGSPRAQSVKLRALTIPSDCQPGSWVSYSIQVDSKNRPPRRFTQRLAVVAREGWGEESGAWVELKTAEGGRTRIERGFFAQGEASDRGRLPNAPLVLRRYQMLTPDGRLFEYPVGGEGGPMPDEDISAMDLLEFKGIAKIDSLAADTLRADRTVLPCSVERVTRYGKDEWPAEDTTFVNRAVMTRTSWRNPSIPVTGYARTILEVSTERAPARAVADSVAAGSAAGGPAAEEAAAGPAGADSAHSAPADSTMPILRPASRRFFYRAEVTLLHLGKDAIPEITQAPEPAPEEGSPRAKPGANR